MGDMLKFLNYKGRNEDGSVNKNATVQRAMERLVGEKGISFMMQLIKDMNGISQSGTDAGIINGLAGNMKRAAIAGKIRVFIQQATSVFDAMAEIDPKYFVDKRMFNVKRTVNEMQEHSGMAWWKDQGNYEIGISHGMESTIWGQGTLLDKVTDAAMQPAGMMDNLAWSWMWNATKNEIAEKHPELKKGSDEYWNAVNDRFMDIINETQVIDSPLHRSQVMRSKDTLIKQSASFMSEPTKKYNMVRNAYVKAVRSGSGKDWGKLLRTIISLVVSGAVNAAVVSGWDWGRKRGDKDAETYGEIWTENFTDNINPLSNIVLVKDYYSAIKDGELPDRQDLTPITDAADALLAIYQRIAEGDSSATDYKLIRDAVSSLGTVVGSPISGIISSAESVVKIIAPGFVRTTKPTLTDKTKPIFNAATDAGMKKSDYYTAYETIKAKTEDGSTPGTSEKAARLAGMNLTTEQKIALSGLVSDGLDKSLKTIKRKGGSDALIETAITRFSEYMGESSDVNPHNTDPSSKAAKFRAELVKDKTLTNDEKNLIYQAFTGSSKTLDFSNAFALTLSQSSEDVYTRSREAAKTGISDNDLLTAYQRKSGHDKADMVKWINGKGYTAEQKTAMETFLYGEAKTDYTNDDTYLASTAFADNEKKQAEALRLSKKGIKVETYAKYSKLKSDQGKNTTLDALYADKTLTAKQKQELEASISPNTSGFYRDYTSADWYYISSKGESQYNKAKIAEKHGISAATYAAETKLYYEWVDGKKGSGKDGALTKKDKQAIIASVVKDKSQQNLLYNIVTGKVKE